MPEEAKKNPLSQEYKSIEQQYRRDVAIVEARPVLQRVGFAAWLIFDLALIAYSLFILPTYISSGMFADGRLMATIAANSESTRAVSAAQMPVPPELGTARAISSGTGSYDFLSEVENENSHWYARFTYYFLFDGGESERHEGFVLPASTASLTALGEDLEAVPRNPRLILEDVHWMRVDRHAIPDVAPWLEERSVFPISDIVYTNNIGLTGAAVGQTDFLITNRTAYSFWEPKFQVSLERSGTAVAVTEVTVPNFLSGESHQVNVRWLEPLPASATVKVVPMINYFDDSLYMDPEE